MSFPAYPEYKDSGVPWLGDVPAHWDVVPLKRQYSVTLGKMLQPDARNEADVERSYLRAANIKWGQVDLTDVKTMWFSPAEATSLTLRYGDLLVSEGGDVGRSAIWRDELADCHFQNSVNRVRAHGDASTGFLFYWMVTIKAKGYVDVLCNKSTIAHFTAEKVKAVPTPIPSVAEQEAIVAFLDRETAKIDALVAEQERLIALLKEKRQAVISHAVTKGLNPDAPMKDSGIEWLGEIPAHWKICRLKHAVRGLDGLQMGPFGGLLTSLADEPTGFKLYGQENTISGDFERGARWITSVQYDEMARYALLPGDMVLTRKGSLGGCRLVPPDIRPGIADSDTVRIRMDDGFIQPDFAMSLMKDAAYVATQVDLTKRGAILAGLNTSVIANLVFALPPLEEQFQISAYLDALKEQFSELTTEAQAAITLLQERRAALISAAVTGKIDVRGLVNAPARANAELDAA